MLSRCIKVVALLVVLSCVLLSAEGTGCTLSFSQKLLDSSSSRFNTYTGTIINVGSAPIASSSVALSTPSYVSQVYGINQEDINNDNADSVFTLPYNEHIAVGVSYSFTFAVRKYVTAQWFVDCDGIIPTTISASTSTKAPTTTTTRAPTTTARPATTTSNAVPSSTSPLLEVTLVPKTCSGGTWWRPAPTTTWQWQLTGSIDTTLDVQMYDIDLFDATNTLIDTLHASGKTVICYFSTQYENWRPDSSQFPASALGNNLDDWEGEKWVDIRSTAVRSIMQARLDLAASKGCDGVEPDNVDGYQTSTGFPITASDQLNYNEFIANQAHARDLSVGLKNDGDQASQLQPFFDWSLNEQCNQFSECSKLVPFINAGKAVFNCEYSGSASSVCPHMVNYKFSTIFKALDLGAKINAECCSYSSSGCGAKAAHSCVSA